MSSVFNEDGSVNLTPRMRLFGQPTNNNRTGLILDEDISRYRFLKNLEFLPYLEKAAKVRGEQFQEKDKEFLNRNRIPAIEYRKVKPAPGSTMFQYMLTVFNQPVVTFYLGGYPACCGINQLNYFSASRPIGIGKIDIKSYASLIQDFIKRSMQTTYDSTNIGHGRVILNLVMSNGTGRTPEEALDWYKEEIASDRWDPDYLYYPEWHYWANVLNTPENQFAFVNENSGNIIATTTVKLGSKTYGH